MKLFRTFILVAMIATDALANTNLSVRPDGVVPPVPSPSPAPPLKFPDIENKTPNEIWISHDRTDGKGKGTQLDPFDGSTATKLDNLLRSYAATTNLVIHLGPGVIETKGNLPTVGWTANTGWKIHGAGMDATTLKQIAIVDDSNFGVIYTSKPKCEVTDLTVDCNFPTLSATIPSSTNKNIYGIGLGGGRIASVRCINAGGLFETFAINISRFVGTGTAAIDFAIVENCIVENTGDHVTGITIQSATGSYPFTETVPDGKLAIIRNCYVDGDPGAANQAFQINGFETGIVEGCKAFNVMNGYYWDTLPMGTLILRDNVLSAATNPIALVGGFTMDRALITGNTLDQTSDVAPNLRTDSALYASIEHNFFVSGGGATFNVAIQTNGTDDANDITNNRFVVGLGNGSGSAIHGRMHGNRAFDGSTISFLADNLFPYNGTAQTGTGSTVLHTNPTFAGLLNRTNEFDLSGSGTFDSTAARFVSSSGNALFIVPTGHGNYVGINKGPASTGDNALAMYGDGGLYVGNSLHLADPGVGNIVAQHSIRARAVTFANLPASPIEGMLVPVTDSNTATWGATIAGGGSNHVLACYNGTAWTVH